jgi:hypothetical protein
LFLAPLFIGTYGSDFALPNPSRVKLNAITLKPYNMVIPVMMEWKVLETVILILHI